MSASQRFLTSRSVLLLGALAAAIMLGGAALTVSTMYARSLEETSTQLRNIAMLIAEQTARALEQVDLLLRAGAEDVHRARADGRGFADRLLADELRSLVGTSPQVTGFVVLDASDRALANTLAEPRAAAQIADQGIVAEHARRPPGYLRIGVPIAGDAPGKHLLPMSRRLESRGGNVDGVLVCAVVGGYFEGLYRALELGRSTEVMMIRDDGVLLAARGLDETALGKKVSRHAEWSGELAGAKSIGVTDRVVDEPVRLTGLTRVPDLPVAIAVSITRSEALAGWRTRALLIMTGALVAASMVFFTALRLAREIRAGEGLQTRLAEGERRLDAIIQSAMDAIITCDTDQRIVLFNQAAEKVFGVQAPEIVGQPLDRLIPERFRNSHRGHVSGYGEHGQTTRRMGGLTVLYGLRADGQEFPIDASISQVELAGRRYFTVILRDITARLAAEDEIARGHRERAELARVAQEALEEERRRVARELHDELGQGLTAIKMDLIETRSMLKPDDRELIERCDVIRGLVDDTVAATRRIASDLRPLMLDDLGLGAAVDWIVQGFAKRTGVKVDSHVDDAVAQIGEPAASAAFRIIQESLTNIARHAQAAQVRVRVEEDDGFVRIEVADDGRGIEPADREKRGSFGLRGIRERARLLGGEAEIRARAEGGTMVTARIPLIARDIAPFRETQPI